MLRAGVIFLFLMPGGALLANKNVAIVEFKVRGADANEAQVVRATVEGVLVNKAGLVLVEREKLNRLLKEQALQGSGLTNPENSIRIGQVLNAHFLMSGELIKTSGSLTLSIKVVNAENAKTLAVENLNAKNLDDLQEKINEELDDKFSGLSTLDNFFPAYVDGDKRFVVRQNQKNEQFEFSVSAKDAGSGDAANFSCEKIDITYFSRIEIVIQGNAPNLSVRLIDDKGKKSKSVSLASVLMKSGVIAIPLADFGIDDDAHYTRIQFFFGRDTTTEFRISRLEIIP